MSSFYRGAVAATLVGLMGASSASAEIVIPVSEDGNAKLSFSGTGNFTYDNRPSYTTLNGGTNAGFERLRHSGNFRGQLSFGDIGDDFWSEINVNVRTSKIKPLDGADSTLDIIVGQTKNSSFGGLNATFGTGNVYGFVANGGVTIYGPGASHTGAFPRSAIGTGFFDTFQRIHGNTSGRDDDILVVGDQSGTLNFISEDRGGTNEETFLGFGYVTDDQHYALQSSSNGEWMSVSFGQKLTSEIGANAVFYKIDSTNRNGRDVDDFGYDFFLTHVTDRVEYGARLTGYGYGSSPTWNADKRTRLRLSSSYALDDKNAVGFNFDYEDFPVINATTGAPIRENRIRRLTLMYGHYVNEYSMVSGYVSRSETDVKSGSLAGNSQDVTDYRLTWNFFF